MKRKHKHRRDSKASSSPLPPLPTGSEREIKLEAPASGWSGLVRAMETEDCCRVPMHAIYYDTADNALAAARIGLRVRREGDQWVQTLKAPGAHAFERLEDNVALGRAEEGAVAPCPDLDRQTPAAKLALRAALRLPDGRPVPALVPVFEVRVQRRVRRVRAGGSTVELALDEGEVLASGHRRAVRELELELVDGAMGDLLALAADWRSRWGLWISTASKAKRGNLLASGRRHGAPVVAEVPRVAGADLNGFTAAVLDVCLDQVIGNAGDIADEGAGDEHVHQLRVGLRRLRTALRAFPGLAREHHAYEPALAEVFRALGVQRDHRHVLQRVQSLMAADGLSPVQLPPAGKSVDAAALVRGDAFQDAILGLVARAEAMRRGGGGPVRGPLRDHLGRLHRQLVRDGRRFTGLSVQRQHRVRKRLKRLRYLGEFATPLFPQAAVERYLAVLKPALDVLGDHQDALAARALYGALDASHPAVAAAMEWLENRQADDAGRARRKLRKLDRAKRFWKGG